MINPNVDGIRWKITIAISDRGQPMNHAGLSSVLARDVPESLKHALADQGAMYTWNCRVKDENGKTWLLIDIDYVEKQP